MSENQRPKATSAEEDETSTPAVARHCDYRVNQHQCSFWGRGEWPSVGAAALGRVSSDSELLHSESSEVVSHPDFNLALSKQDPSFQAALRAYLRKAHPDLLEKWLRSYS